MTWVSAPRKSLGPRELEAALSIPGVLGAEPGAAHSSPGVAAQESEGWAAPAPIAGPRSWWGPP